MSTSLLVILALGAAFACWAVLTLLGGERARQLTLLEAKKAAPPPPTKLLSVSDTPAAVAKPAISRKAKPAKPPAAGKFGAQNAR